MCTWHSYDNDCYRSTSDYTETVQEDGEWGDKARSCKLVKQI